MPGDDGKARPGVDALVDTALVDTALVDTVAASDESLGASRDAPVRLVTTPSAADGRRYEAEGLLGAGGMGEVHRCRDAVIGRHVAMKVLRDQRAESARATTRFLREAQVQGQLEHPAIVPVYDLGTDDSGAPFFTMKRVRGETLAEVIDKLASEDQEAVARFSTRKLLSTFSDVCQAIQFAHAHGVVHRDLKPSNIMLGRFGEVYVLDWGIAKLLEREDKEHDDALFVEGRSGATGEGALLGTPGYLSPEQAIGEGVDERSDVYALGAILFEMLTLRALHGGETAMERVTQTLDQAATDQLIEQARDRMPPELAAVCSSATRVDCDERLASVAEMNELVERYLDGDRDQQRRRELADEHVEAAAAEIDSVSESVEARKRVLQELGRALVLDPTRDEAQRLLLRVMVEPSVSVPEEVKHSYNARVGDHTRLHAKMGVITSLAQVPLVVLGAYLLDVRSWWPVVAAAALLLVSAARAWQVAQQQHPERASLVPSVCMFMLLLACLHGLAGPLIVIPASAAAAIAIFMVTPRLSTAFATTATIASFMGPWVLSKLGLIAEQYRFEDGQLIVLPQLIEHTEFGTTAVLVITSCVSIGLLGAVINDARRALWQATMRQELTTWQLRQLVPEQKP